MAGNMLDTYTQGLAALKKRYSSADQTGQMDIKKEGLQYRQKALNDGVDLNQLEDGTNKLMDPNYNAATAGADPNEQSYRADLFKQVSSAPRMGQMPIVSPNNTTPSTVSNPYYDKANAAMGNLEKMMGTPYTYNPDTDPLVAGARSNATKRSALATTDMMNDMNSRGILNSTVTSDRATDIRNQNEDAVTAMLPQFAQMGYQQHQQEIGNEQNLVNSFRGMGDSEMRNKFQESALTGKYMPPGLQDLYDKTIQAKQIAENPNATSSQLAEAKTTADALRTQIKQLGGDPNLVGFDNNASQAADAVGKYGGLTFPAQQAMMGVLENLNNQYMTMPDGTGDMVQGLSGFSQLAPYFKNLEGKDTYRQGQLDMQNKHWDMMYGPGGYYGAGGSGSSAGAPSFSETQQVNLNSFVNSVIGGAKSKDEAVRALKTPSALKAMKDKNIDPTVINKKINEYYDDPTLGKDQQHLTDKEVYDSMQRELGNNRDYLSGTSEERATIEADTLAKWKKIQKTG